MQRRLLRGPAEHSQILRVLFSLSHLRLLTSSSQHCISLLSHRMVFTNHILALCPQFPPRINRQNAPV